MIQVPVTSFSGWQFW